MPARWSLALVALTACAAAQVPFQHFVVSTFGAGSGSSAWFVDPLTGDVTPVTGLAPPLTDLSVVTCEPLTGALYVADPFTTAGMTHVPLTGRVAGTPSPISWFGLPTGITDAQFGPGGNVFLLIGGRGPGAGLWTGALFGGFAVRLGAITDGVAVAADGAAAYVLTYQTGGPSTIWRYDVATGAFVQAVGGLPEATALDVVPGGTSHLLVGTLAGDLYLADASTGQFTLFRAVGHGGIVALRYSHAGQLLFATDRADLFTLGSLPNALARLPRLPTDIDLGTLDAASFFTLAGGCAGSGNHVPMIGSTGLPSLGNARFAITVAAGAGGAPATLAIGDSRANWLGIPLPFDLAPLGAPGCAVAASGLVLLASTLSGTGPGAGTATQPLPVPSQVALQNIRLMSQWWILDPPANALGLTVSDGGEAIVR